MRERGGSAAGTGAGGGGRAMLAAGCVRCGVPLDADAVGGLCERCGAAERIAEHHRSGREDPEIAARRAELGMPPDAPWGRVRLWRTPQDDIECGLLWLAGSGVATYRVVIRPTRGWDVLVEGFTVELFGSVLPAPDGPNVWRLQLGDLAAFALRPWQRLAWRPGSSAHAETRWHPKDGGTFYVRGPLGRGPAGSRRLQGDLADTTQALKLLGALPTSVTKQEGDGILPLEEFLTALEKALPELQHRRRSITKRAVADALGRGETTIDRWLLWYRESRGVDLDWMTRLKPALQRWQRGDSLAALFGLEKRGKSRVFRASPRPR
jgi:hypothetical protein